MHCCTFFGHRSCPAGIEAKLREVLVKLIEEENVERFYVGRQGAFDGMVYRVLQELSAQYPRIFCTVVLERLPQRGEKMPCGFAHTSFPEGLETVPPRWAISRRNEWMLKQSDYVVTYITHDWGGAARFAARAVRQGKQVINVAEF